MKKFIFFLLIFALLNIYAASGFARSKVGLIKVRTADSATEAYVNEIVVGNEDLSTTGTAATIQTARGTSTSQTITIVDTGEDIIKGVDSITPTDGYLKETVKVDCQDDDNCDLGFTETGDEDEGDTIIVWNIGTYDVIISEDADTVHIPPESVTLKQAETKEFIRGTVKWLTNAETQINKVQSIKLGTGIVSGSDEITSTAVNITLEEDEVNQEISTTASATVTLPLTFCDASTVGQWVEVSTTGAFISYIDSLDTNDDWMISDGTTNSYGYTLANQANARALARCGADDLIQLVRFNGVVTASSAGCALYDYCVTGQDSYSSFGLSSNWARVGKFFTPDASIDICQADFYIEEIVGTVSGARDFYCEIYELTGTTLSSRLGISTVVDGSAITEDTWQSFEFSSSVTVGNSEHAIILKSVGDGAGDVSATVDASNYLRIAYADDTGLSDFDLGNIADGGVCVYPATTTLFAQDADDIVMIRIHTE